MTVPPDDREERPDDPFQLLRAANTIPDPSDLGLPPLQDLVPDATRPQVDDLARRRRRRHRLLWVAPLAVIGTASVAAAVIAQRDATNPLDIGCYAEANLEADTVIIQARDEGQAAVERCAELWRDGTIGDSSERAPALVRCILPSGSVGVFPGGPEVCEQLAGEDRYEQSEPDGRGTTAPDDPGAVIRLRDALVERTRRTACLHPDDGRRVAEEELRRHGLEHWSITVGPGATGAGFDDERPCVSYSVEPERRAVVLVPFPRQE